MLTKNGIIKKVASSSFEHVRQSGLIAIKLKKDDLLKWVKLTAGQNDIVLTTRAGQSIRFSERDVRPMGRNAAGVKAIRLKKNDEVVGMDIADTSVKEKLAQYNLLVIMGNGYGKKTPLKQYKKQRRGGSGIKTAKITPKTGELISAKILDGEEEELIAISRKGQVIRTELRTIPTLGRATQGVRIMRLDAGDKLASITTL